MTARTHWRRAALGAAAASLVALACVTGESDADRSPAPAARGTGSPSARHDTDPKSACATAVAEEPCTNDPVVCEIGEHPSEVCNGRLRCNGIVWKNDRSAVPCTAACPSRPLAELPEGCATASAATLRCEYEGEHEVPGTTCGCTPAPRGLEDASANAHDASMNGDGGDASGDAGAAGDASASADGGDASAPQEAGAILKYVWKCVRSEPGCPRTRPHVGSPCVRLMTCDYGRCLFEDGAVMQCAGGFWVSDETSSCDR